MLAVVDAPRCPYCARVRITLAEKGVEYEAQVIDLSDRPAWVYELNPSGRVPILRDGDRVLPESAVIDELLEELYPEPPLLPSDPYERAAARLLIFRHDEFTDPYYAYRRREPGAEEALARALAFLDDTLHERRFLTGAAFGLADIAYVPWLLRARDAMGVELAPYPQVDRWLEELSQQPAVAAEVEVVAAL